jgi:hypothetical protein
MRVTFLLASLIAFSMIAQSATAQSIGIGNAVHGPDNQVIVGGKVVGQDPDPLVRLEIRRRTESMGGG